MNKYLKIFFLTLFIIHCSSDASSENILSDNNENEGGGGFTGGGNQTIPELDVELITTYDDQTASFSTTFDNYQRSFIVHVPPNFDFSTQATFRPSRAAGEAIFAPAPAPITIRSYFFIKAY